MMKDLSKGTDVACGRDAAAGIGTRVSIAQIELEEEEGGDQFENGTCSSCTGDLEGRNNTTSCSTSNCSCRCHRDGVSGKKKQQQQQQQHSTANATDAGSGSDSYGNAPKDAQNTIINTEERAAAEKQSNVPTDIDHHGGSADDPTMTTAESPDVHSSPSSSSSSVLSLSSRSVNQQHQNQHHHHSQLQSIGIEEESESEYEYEALAGGGSERGSGGGTEDDEEGDHFDYHLNLDKRSGSFADNDNITSNRSVGDSSADTEDGLDSKADALTDSEVTTKIRNRSSSASASATPNTTLSRAESNLSSASAVSSFYTRRNVEDRVEQGARAMMQRRFDEHSSFGSYDSHFPRLDGGFRRSPSGGSQRMSSSGASVTSKCSSTSHSSRSFSRRRSAIATLPKFERDELVLGKRLGKGSFSNVDTIRGITINERRPSLTAAGNNRLFMAKSSTVSQTSTSSTTQQQQQQPTLPVSFPKPLKPAKGGGKALRREDTIAYDDQESRQFIAQHCFRNNGEPRYVLKSIRRDVLFNSMGDDTQSMLGLCDLAVETMFLSSIVHPNIIKLRAISTADPCSGQYFLVLDRLQETLQQRMENKWAKRERRLYSTVGRFIRDRSGKKRLDFFEHRLERAFDLSSAIQHLHAQKVVHRDIKPDNIGFDIRDDIKLFDFGMARELRDDYKTEDGNYRLSKCGSPRYMAPEVFLGQPYNSSVDVYSFAVVMYEMVALERAFSFVYKECAHNTKKRGKQAAGDQMVVEEEFARLIFEEDRRPNLTGLRAPPSIKELFPLCWSSNPEYRCDMSIINSTLRKELILLRKGDESQLPDFTKRRSTYVFRGGPGSFKNAQDSGSSRSLAKSVESILKSKGSRHNIDVFNASFASLDRSMHSIRFENEK